MNLQMEISEFDNLFEKQKDVNCIPAGEIAYFGGIERKEGIKSQMSSYIEGFREAADAIYNKFTTSANQGHIWVQDTIVFPLIFIHRHCVELELKRLFCLADNKFKELSHNNIHQLCKLWRNVKDFVVERASRLNITFDINAIEHYIQTIDSYDKGSFRFRYPMDTSLNSNNVNLEIINIVAFHEQMNRFHISMEELFISLNGQVNEWKLDKNFKRQFSFCLRINIDGIKNALSFTYPEPQSLDKPWLGFSEIPKISDEEREREYNYCQTLSNDVKELLLILYYSLDSIKLNKIASSKSKERLMDILKVCNDNYSNENIFGRNLNNSFLRKFRVMLRRKSDIISLAEEILSLFQ